MEAVGLAASIIAIVQLTCACLKLGHKVLGPLQHSSKGLETLSATLYSFNATIKNLQTHFEINEEDQARLMALQHLESPLKGCEEALEMIRERLQNIIMQMEIQKMFDLVNPFNYRTAGSKIPLP